MVSAREKKNEARQGDTNWMGVSIPEMLTLESKPEGSEEVSHTYKGRKPEEFVHNSRSKGAR